MPSKCFVPYCKSGYESDNKRRKAAGELRPSIFEVPSDMNNLLKWRSAILRKDRELMPGDKICELHFEKSCIERQQVYYVDGVKEVFPLKRPRLIPGSVPTIFPSAPSYLSASQMKRKRLKERHVVVPTKRPCPEDGDEYSDGTNDDVQNMPATIELDFSDDDTSSPITPFSDEPISTRILFEQLKFDETHECWSKCMVKDTLILQQWDDHYQSPRKIIILADLTVKVFIKDVATHTHPAVCTANEVVDLINIVAKYKACSSSTSTTKCLGYVRKGEGLCKNCKKGF